MTHVFNNITKDMAVLQESTKEHIGTVKFIKFGEGEGAVDLPEIDTIIEMLAQAIDFKTDYPKEIYERLYASGFLVVERGLQPDIYVLPNQIVHVVDGEVHIEVDEDELLVK